MTAVMLPRNSTTTRGTRPGRPTAMYLEKVLVRLTVAGALFLAIVALGPQLADEVARGVRRMREVTIASTAVPAAGA